MLTGWSWWVAICFAITVGLIIKPLRVPIPARLRCNSASAWFCPKTIVIGFALAPALAVLLLLATTALSLETFKAGVVGDVLQPWAIIVLFFSLSVVSVSLDVSGLLAYLSMQVVARTGRSGLRLFVAFFAISSVLTIVTSNDIVIMTLTPIVIYSCASMHLDPRPHLFAEFFAANVWSSLLFSGNPTNILVAVANRINFLEFTRYSGLPTLGAGVTLLLTLFALFWRRVAITVDKTPVLDIDSALKSRVSAVVGTLILVSCLVALAVGSFFNWPVWALTLPFAVVTVIKDVVVDLTGGAASQLSMMDASESAGLLTAESETVDDAAPAADADTVPLASDVVDELGSPAPVAATAAAAATPWSRFQRRFRGRLPTLYAVLARQPWALAPFVFCMFVLVEALSFHGWTSLLAGALAQAVGDSVVAGSFVVGLASTLAVNLLNNQPATIFLVRVLEDPSFRNGTSADAHRASLFSLALASNYGANLTIIGALAGLMWRQILADKGLPPVGYFEFVKYGVVITIPLSLVAFGLLVPSVESF